MPWNPDWPIGSISVKANKTTGVNNMHFIEDSMGKEPVGTNTNITRDHFWNVGGNENGRHRFINSPAFTVGGIATDPVIGSGMDGVFYLKTINARPEWFHRNTSGIFQVTPGYLTGTKTVTGSYSNLVAVPANVWGEIFMWRTTQGRLTGQTGFFRSDGTSVEAWALYLGPEGSSATLSLKFGNGSDSSGNLNIQVRAQDASAGNTWNYRITYRAI